MDQGGSGGGGGTSGFDMSKLSSAGKILVIAGALLFIDSFLPWQKACADTGFGSFCVSASSWGGNGSFFGVLTGLLALAVVVWEVMQLMGMSMNLGMPASKISAYLGFATAAFGILKFIFIVGNDGALFGWIGLILCLAVAYGAWMRFQEPATESGSMGGGTMGGGGSMPPPSTPPTTPPSTPPSTPPPTTPPS